MLVLWGVVLLVGLPSSISGSTNSSSRNVNFSIDEVAALNRQFLDYLLEFDEAEVIDEQDLRCIGTMRMLSQAYVNRDRHGLEWFDSWGKIPSGLYYGNRHAFGNFEQCRQFSWNEIRSQHCTITIGLPNPELPTLNLGLCVPNFCRQSFVERMYGDYLRTLGAVQLPTFGGGLMCYRDSEVEFDGGVVTAIVIYSIIAALVIASTCYEVVQNLREQKPQPLFSSFSLYSNVRSILHITAKITDPEKRLDMIECANGIRALSMIWVVIVHVHETLVIIPIDNVPSRLSYLQSFGHTLLNTSGSQAVDTFLMISGMLVALNTLKELDKKGKINPLMLYLHRYIRLTGPYAALILFNASFSKYLSEGLLWRPIMEHRNHDAWCAQYWWSALLYIQNYVNPMNMCFPHTWYLSVDMQLYIIGPALIYPLWRWGKRVLIAIGGLAMLSILCVLTTFLINEFRFNLQHPGTANRAILTYYPTHARMSVWLLGTIFGYFLHTKRTKDLKLPNGLYAIGWSLCLILLGFNLYANHALVSTPYEDFSHVIDAFYEAFRRPLFAICVMWLIFASINGKAGLVGDFLSAQLWQPLAKLSFTVYLLHVLLIQTASVANVKTDLHFSVVDLFYRIWGALGLSVSVALLWSAVFEIPFVTLDKLLLR